MRVNKEFFIKELEYSEEEIIKMTKILPSIYGLSIENIKIKIQDMEEIGYTKEEILKMTKSLPTIYGLSIENIKDKINVVEKMEEIQEDKKYYVKNPKDLMQSALLTYARVKETGTFKDAFLSNSLFSKKYGEGTDNKSLKEKYKDEYEKFKESISVEVKLEGEEHD